MRHVVTVIIVVEGYTDSDFVFSSACGLWLDADIYHGRTQHCDTFNNDPLTGDDEDFIVKAIEVWGLNDQEFDWLVICLSLYSFLECKAYYMFLSIKCFPIRLLYIFTATDEK